MTRVDQLLELLSDGKKRTAPEISKELGLNRQVVQDMLYRASRKGLVSREQSKKLARNKSKMYVYTVS